MKFAKSRWPKISPGNVRYCSFELPVSQKRFICIPGSTCVLESDSFTLVSFEVKPMVKTAQYQ